MRKHMPSMHDTRVVERFLFFPKTLPLITGKIEQRWWEKAKIVQIYRNSYWSMGTIIQDWQDERWNKD